MNFFHTAAVAHAWDETSALRGLRLEVPADVQGSHRAPGQYIKLRSDGKEGFFAFANAPGAPLELLVKRGAPLSDALAILAAGSALEISGAQGKGYPVDENRGRDLLLFAAGSGITPIRAVVQHLLAARDGWGRVLLFWGQRHPDEFAYQSEWPSWDTGRIELHRVLSRPEGSGWTGPTGYVQNALLEVRPSVENAAAFLCGMKGMVEGVTAALTSLGMPRERVFLNY